MRKVVLALLLVSVIAAGVHWGTFVAGGSDSYCYAYQAERWASFLRQGVGGPPGRLQVREINNAASYLSSNDMRLHVGLGDAAEVQQLEIQWPSGRRQTLTGVKANQVLTVKEPE